MSAPRQSRRHSPASACVVVITGAAGGMGWELCRAFAGRGDTVVATDLNAARLARVVEDLRARGSPATVTGVVADVSTEEGVEPVFQAADQHGPLDVLVNAAGIGPVAGVLDLSVAEFDRVLAVCLRRAFLCARAAIHRMVRRQRRGRVINISSVNAVRMYRGQVAYATAKAGLEGLTRALALDVAPYGITVNAVAPGIIRSSANDGLDRNAARRAQLLSGIPTGRFGAPEDMTRAVLWLAEPSSAFVTGAVLPIDGGTGLPLIGETLPPPTLPLVAPPMADPRPLW